MKNGKEIDHKCDYIFRVEILYVKKSQIWQQSNILKIYLKTSMHLYEQFLCTE